MASPQDIAKGAGENRQNAGKEDLHGGRIVIIMLLCLMFLAE